MVGRVPPGLDSAGPFWLPCRHEAGFRSGGGRVDCAITSLPAERHQKYAGHDQTDTGDDRSRSALSFLESPLLSLTPWFTRKFSRTNSSPRQSPAEPRDRQLMSALGTRIYFRVTASSSDPGRVTGSRQDNASEQNANPDFENRKLLEIDQPRVAVLQGESQHRALRIPCQRRDRRITVVADDNLGAVASRTIRMMPFS